jgi:hypothetical protein
MPTLNIYIQPGEKIKLIRKANKLGISLSRLMIVASLAYEAKLGEESFESKARSGGRNYSTAISRK